MATTKKEGAPPKERPGRSSLTPAAMQNPRARATKSLSPAARSSEKEDAAVPPPQRKPMPNYLKPTFSSSPEAAKQARIRASLNSLPCKKGLDSRAAPPHRSSSFNPAKVQAKPALSSRPSFSERTAKGKATSHLSRRGVSPPRRRPSGSAKGRCSSVTSATSSNASPPSSPKAATEGALSNEDKEAALDILNLDLEETILLEIPPVVDTTTLPADEPAYAENDPEELTAFVEHEHVVNPVAPDEEVSKHKQDDAEAEDYDSEEGNKKEDDTIVEEKDHAEVHQVHEEVPPTMKVEEEDSEKPGETDEKVAVEAPGEPDGEDVAAPKVQGSDEGEKEEAGVDGGGERIKLRVNGVKDEAAAKEKRKEAAQHQQQQGKKEAPPAYNDVIEETASKLVEKRKSKVKALVGAFETVIELDSGGPAQ